MNDPFVDIRYKTVAEGLVSYADTWNQGYHKGMEDAVEWYLFDTPLWSVIRDWLRVRFS